MAKKQTRRSISVSRVTYERLKAFCETQGISMSQFVETRVGDFLGEGAEPSRFAPGDYDHGDDASVAPASAAPVSPAISAFRAMMPGPTAPRPIPPVMSSGAPRSMASTMSSGAARPPIAAAAPAPRPATPYTSAAARFAVEPPPPIIKPKAAEPAPPPVPRTADQIFTF
jgi:hypothetical protein